MLVKLVERKGAMGEVKEGVKSFKDAEKVLSKFQLVDERLWCGIGNIKLRLNQIKWRSWK